MTATQWFLVPTSGFRHSRLSQGYYSTYHFDPEYGLWSKTGHRPSLPELVTVLHGQKFVLPPREYDLGRSAPLEGRLSGLATLFVPLTEHHILTLRECGVLSRRKASHADARIEGNGRWHQKPYNDRHTIYCRISRYQAPKRLKVRGASYSNWRSLD